MGIAFVNCHLMNDMCKCYQSLWRTVDIPCKLCEYLSQLLITLISVEIYLFVINLLVNIYADVHGIVHVAYSSLGRTGLIIISFSTVSCCPLQFSVNCTNTLYTIFKLEPCFNFGIEVIFVTVYSTWDMRTHLAPFLVAFCWCIEHISCMIVLSSWLFRCTCIWIVSHLRWNDINQHIHAWICIGLNQGDYLFELWSFCCDQVCLLLYCILYSADLVIISVIHYRHNLYLGIFYCLAIFSTVDILSPISIDINESVCHLSLSNSLFSQTKRW